VAVDSVFSGRPVWEVTVDDVQQTTEVATCSEQCRGRRRGRDYYNFMVSGVVGGGRQDKNLSPTSLNSIPVYKITKAATKPARSLLKTC